MRVMTLGSLGRGAHVARGGVGFVEPKELPSSQSVVACLRGERGAIASTVLTTFLRTLLLLPGVYLAGGRGWRAWMGASAGSATITLFLFFWHAAHEKGRREALSVTEPGALPRAVVDTTLVEGA